MNIRIFGILLLLAWAGVTFGGMMVNRNEDNAHVQIVLTGTGLMLAMFSAAMFIIAELRGAPQRLWNRLLKNTNYPGETRDE